MAEVVDSKLKQLVIDRKFQGSAKRLNCAPDHLERVQYKGQTFLRRKIMSDVLKDGEIFDLCKAKFPWCEQVTINKNIRMKPHFDKNVGLSAICFFSPQDTFRGGGLATEAHHFVEPGVWHFFDGRNQLHWVLPWEGGDRYSIVCYRKSSDVKPLTPTQACSCVEQI